MVPVSEQQVWPPVSARREDDEPIFDYPPVTRTISLWWYFLASLPVITFAFGLIAWAVQS